MTLETLGARIRAGETTPTKELAEIANGLAELSKRLDLLLALTRMGALVYEPNTGKKGLPWATRTPTEEKNG